MRKRLRNLVFQIISGDALKELDKLKSSSIQMVFTSPNPPYSGKDKTELLMALNKCKRLLTADGVLFIQLGDYYDQNGAMFALPESMVMLIKSSGWHFRNRLIWHRTEKYKQLDRNRFRIDAEFIYMFTHDENHYFNDRLGLQDSSIINCEMENVKPSEFKSGFPEKLIEVCLRCTTLPHDTVLDMFAGTGTTGVVALKNKRNFIGIEQSPENKPLLENRLKKFDFMV